MGSTEVMRSFSGKANKWESQAEQGGKGNNPPCQGFLTLQIQQIRKLRLRTGVSWYACFKRLGQEPRQETH